MKRIALVIIYTLLLSSVVKAKIWFVPDSVVTIQVAIDQSVKGDTVLVADGLYYENISFKGKEITVASYFLMDQDSLHISNTVIDGSKPSLRKYGSTVYFMNGGSLNSKLIGFTITGGTGTVVEPLDMDIEKVGGGIFLFEASATIENNIIVGNSIDISGNGAGGGVFYFSNGVYTNLAFQNNKVINNHVTADSLAAGGGLALYGKTLLNYNMISENSVNSNIEAVGGGLVNWNLGDDLDYEFQMKHNTISNNNINAGEVSWGAGCGVLLLGERSLIYDNTIVGNSSTQLNCLGGGVTVIYSFPFLLSGNKVRDNEAEIGGGIALWYTSPLIRNNLIVDNIANEAGGVFINKSPWNYLFIDKAADSFVELEKYERKLQSYNTFQKIATPNQTNTDAFLLNNTIVKNQAMISGGGIVSTYGVTRIESSIIRENVSPDSAEVFGECFVRFSNVAGGYEGEENIDIDPVFADTVNYYLTPDQSPCIDSGNPSAIYNDPADVSDPWMARFPALGTVANDMGAYGGDPLSRTIDHAFLGPAFREFAGRVANAQIVDRGAIVDSFMNAVPSFPFIEGDNLVYFLYRGGASHANVPGDMNGWQPNAFPMTRLAGTNLFYREEVFEADARLDYKFVVNGSSWILDPLNDRKMMSGYGPNSELAMPDYVGGPEVNYYHNIPHGTLKDKYIYSTNLNNNRKVRIYTPSEYNDHPEKSYPVLLVHDGLEYLSIANANNILDYLIAHDRIVPIIAVFVPPVNRNEEYAFSQKEPFTKFILEEVMTHIDTSYRTEKNPAKRAMTGISFGGLISTYICYNHPEEFGLCAPCSPAYWPENQAVFMSLVSGPTKDLKIYMDWGTYETEIMVDGRTLSEILPQKGYELKWNEWHEGHSWGNWRQHLDIALEYFFASPTNVPFAGGQTRVPDHYILNQNYPNPFNPVTKIDYALPEDSDVVIQIFNIRGQLIETLIDARQNSGYHHVFWNAHDVPSGLYLYRLQAGQFSKTVKMLLVK